jgi:hypothetical protein
MPTITLREARILIMLSSGGMIHPVAADQYVVTGDNSTMEAVSSGEVQSLHERSLISSSGAVFILASLGRLELCEAFGGLPSLRTGRGSSSEDDMVAVSGRDQLFPGMIMDLANSLRELGAIPETVMPVRLRNAVRDRMLRDMGIETSEREDPRALLRPFELPWVVATLTDLANRPYPVLTSEGLALLGRLLEEIDADEGHWALLESGRAVSHGTLRHITDVLCNRPDAQMASPALLSVDSCPLCQEQVRRASSVVGVAITAAGMLRSGDLLTLGPDGLLTAARATSPSPDSVLSGTGSTRPGRMPDLDEDE